MKSTISARAARAMTLLFIRSAASCARQSPTVFSPAHVIEKLAHILARQARRLGNLDRRHGSVVLPEDCQDLLTRCSQRPCHNLTPISPLQPLEMRCQLIGQCHAKQPLELDFLRSTRIPSLAYRKGSCRHARLRSRRRNKPGHARPSSNCLWRQPG